MHREALKLLNDLAEKPESFAVPPRESQEVRVLEERTDNVAKGKWDERDHSEAREKLLNVLRNTTAYNPDRMLQRLPIDGLYEERAYLLGRMGQHRVALTLYAHKLHELKAPVREYDRSLRSLAHAKAFIGARPTPQQQQSTRGVVSKNIAEIEGAEESKFSFSSAESAAESSRSDTEDLVEGPTSSEELMLDDALRLLSRRSRRCQLVSISPIFTP
ncbi:hypothetical protein AXG93_215s1020 [Marchantia polymorpha subsp. ruderalis]|uniref:Uncharacterized protein n=1 Tax=Marchantia polymorpha subsp. ruderalis TaxID=1480154 RepID=A0A176W3R4_MARPO|nr:hypothetical protein AXG93_215s1020 [Marchantia polymorpha subsp. ruderalis]